MSRLLCSFPDGPDFLRAIILSSVIPLFCHFLSIFHFLFANQILSIFWHDTALIQASAAYLTLLLRADHFVFFCSGRVSTSCRLNKADKSIKIPTFLTFSTPVCFSIEIRAHKHTEPSSNNSGPFHLNSPWAQRVDSFVAFLLSERWGEIYDSIIRRRPDFGFLGKDFFFRPTFFHVQGTVKKRKKTWMTAGRH